MADAYCPHCLLVIASGAPASFPPAPMRCPHCRLAVAPGRARAHGAGDADAPAGAGTSNSAAGILKNAARRTDAEPADPEQVRSAIALAADEVGTPLERLRMLDYEHVSRRHPELPSLAEIFAVHGTWKAARTLAAGRLLPA